MHGIDWEGPVSVPEEDTVTVEETEDVLSTVQKKELSSLHTHTHTHTHTHSKIF